MPKRKAETELNKHCVSTQMKQLETTILISDTRHFLYGSLEYLRQACGKKLSVFFDARGLKFKNMSGGTYFGGPALPILEIEQGIKRDTFSMDELVKKVSLLFWFWGCLTEPIAQHLPSMLEEYIFEYYEKDMLSGVLEESIKSLPGMPEYISMIQRHNPEKDATPWNTKRRQTVSKEISELRRLIDGGMKDLETVLQKKITLLKEYEIRTCKSVETMDSSLIDYLEEKMTPIVENLFATKKYEFRMVLNYIPAIEI